MDSESEEGDDDDGNEHGSVQVGRKRVKYGLRGKIEYFKKPKKK